ncbi:MAG: PfkB family carbohydrate kinase [Nitrososphaerales archaeon]
MEIDFLTVGNVTHDITPEGFRLGGTVSFAAVTARRLGWHPGILTRASLDGLTPGAPGPDGMVRTTGLSGTPLADIPVVVQPSPVATTFTNLYTPEGRTQYVTAVADPVTPDGLPREWVAAPVVLLGSIARELPPHWATVFPRALMGIAPQGLMRRWDERGLVTHGRWDDGGMFLRRCDAVFLSREDVGGDEAYIAELANQTRLLVVTDGYHGATVYQNGQATAIPPRPAREVDPTGAGDVFATAFLVRYAETRNPFLAARFANIVASMSVEAAGYDAVPERAEVERWVEAESLAGKA